MFEYRIESRRISHGEIDAKKCALCGTSIITGDTESYFDVPHDMYGLPVGHEIEWFDNLVDYCPNCGLAAWDISEKGFIPKTKEYDLTTDNFCVDKEKLEELKRIAKEDIPDTEKKLKSACLLNLIDKGELYLYFDFMDEQGKAQKLRDEILNDLDGAVKHMNPNLEKEGVTYCQDAALVEIELNRRNGNFAKALELCRKYKKMPDQQGVYDAPQWYYDGYRKVIKEEARLCKHENKETRFGSEFRRKN